MIALAGACWLLCAPAQAAKKHSKKAAAGAGVALALGEAGLRASLSRFDAAPGQMGHPRLFKGEPDYDGIVAAARAERNVGLRSLVDTLKRHPAAGIAPALRAQIENHDLASWWQQDRLLEGMAEAAFAWYVSGDGWLLEEMRARMRLFGPAVLKHGCAGDIAQTRDYVWYFALAYDFAYAAMAPAERQLVADIVTTCANAGLAQAPATLRQHPDNGIAFNALGKLVGALLIMRGEAIQADRLLATALPAYVAAMSPWGGSDGGFANGSSYALWDAGESLLAWDLVERVLGAPLYRKPWLAQLARFITYTLPPGTPAGAFGDGAEVARPEEWARLGKAIAYRSDTALSRWYAQELKGEDYARLQILLSPRAARGAAVLPPDSPDSASFPSVGVVAMHSALDDPKRVSVLFKSSPFGSLNHSHADQNSFVIYAKGKVLAMDSGAYDSYNSAHWRQWYKQTRAHNAITFDGGKGQQLGPQGLGERTHAGRLTRFTHTPGYDIAAGEAGAAYDGDIEQARRTLVFIRPATLVVVDQLRSGAPHLWEWNLHTLAPLTGAATRFQVNVDGVALCGALAADQTLDYSGEEGYLPAPEKGGGPHYWHRFALNEARKEALFVAVLGVDCKGEAGRIKVDGQTASVAVAGRTVDVGQAGVKVR